MAETLVIKAAAEAPQEIVDVWSRTAPKYRRRAALMLTIMAILFAGLCNFTFWLRTGAYWPWLSDNYGDLMYRSFQPTGVEQITLSQFLTSPISVQAVPIHSVIVGVLFASLCSIPLLVAILYRFPCSVGFTAMVVFFAAMPWLGITILSGCALASLRPFRFSFKYASALLGLLPIAGYFVMASWEPADASPRAIQNRALLYAPWVLALLSSCVICAVALGFARLINYRPGGVSPVLALLFAIPVYLFHTQVGRDELEYRVLAGIVGPQSATLFVTEDIGAKAHRDATRLWGEATNESFDQIHKRLLRSAVSQAISRAENDRARAVAICDDFIAGFSRSRHVPSVLFLKGQAQDERLLRSALMQDHRVEYRVDLPGQGSRRTWQTIRERFPDSVVNAMASFKLALLHGCDGNIDAAIADLRELVNRFDPARPTSGPAPGQSAARVSVFQKTEPSEELGIDLKLLVDKARRLLEMSIACKDDAPRAFEEVFGSGGRGPATPVHPLQVLLSLDDTDPHYRANLEGICRVFPKSETARYAQVRLALMEPAVSRRIERFRRASVELAGRPSGAEALFQFGGVLQEDSLFDEARGVFAALMRDYPESCWAQEAKDRLASLSMIESVP